MRPETTKRYDGKPWPLDVETQALVDAIDFYLARYPEGPDAEALAAWGARLYLSAHDFVQAEHRAMWMLFRGLSPDSARFLLMEIETQRRRTPEVGESRAIGTPQTIGEPQDIGEAQTIGEPQDVGGDLENVDSEIGEGGEDVDEYEVP